MCLRRAPEKYIAGAALDRAALDVLFRLWEPNYIFPINVYGGRLSCYLIRNRD
jgi:hypothetical protein